MATYFQGSNDNSQTLHLLNPAGYAAATYTDAGAAAAAAAAANSGNMILLNPQSIPSQAVAAQHFLGIPFPASAQIASMASPNPNQAPPHSVSQDMNSSLLASRIGAQAFNHLWRNRPSGSGGSSNGELSFMNDHITDISHLGLRRSAMGSLQEQQQQQQQQQSAAMLSSALSLQQQQQSEHSHSHGHGQGLSLSLSSQQPPLGTLAADSDMNCSAISATSEENLTRADRSANKWSSFRAPNSSRDGPGLLESATFQLVGKNQIQHQHHLDSAHPVPAAATGGTIVGFSNAVLGSRYLKAAQQLLDEVVNVGKGLKPDTGRQQQQQQLKVSMGGSRENSVTEGGGGGAAGGDRPPADLTPAERQELQMKKAKLVAMLDEVDQRYRQYYHQMQIVVQSFENAAGYGSARTYTAVALQTISRHFRCLRDAISGQIKAISKNLGDEDSTSKGETSRLRFVDQQLRQQRALQQLGMIQQHAWRPQRGLPERSVSVLRSWLFEHFLHPYPKDADKHMLAKKTGLTRNQVSNWFINARVRLWKPMVEEMYLEEQKEAETERGSSGEKSGKENSDKKDDSESKEGSGSGNGGAVGYEQVSGKPTSNIHENISNNSEDSRKTGSASRSENVMRNPHHQTFDMDETTTMHNQIYSEVNNDGLRHAQQQQQQLKKARTMQESASLLSPNMSLDVDFKSDETNSAEFSDTPHNKFSEERHNTEADFSLVHNAMVHADNGGSFGSYHHQLGDLSRLSQGSFAPTRFSGSGGVSLTLGLQHTDGGLSLQGSQHSFLSPQGLGLGRRHDLGANSSDYCSIESSAAHSAASIYDNLGFQNQKRFATQLMH